MTESGERRPLVPLHVHQKPGGDGGGHDVVQIDGLVMGDKGNIPGFVEYYPRQDRLGIGLPGEDIGKNEHN